MANYLINQKPDEKGLNEVHNTTCAHLPDKFNQVNLGSHDNEIAAVDYAKRHGWPNADGCYHCCPKAHRG